jgi:hypothetical protein
MKEQLISFETAKLAKEKGFALNSYSGFVFDKKGIELNLAFYDMEDKYARPTQSLLQKWLRDIHNIQINIENYHSIKEEKPYNVYIEYMINEHWTYKDFDEKNDYNTYEEALEKGLQEGLKLINIEII